MSMSCSPLTLADILVNSLLSYKAIITSHLALLLHLVSHLNMSPILISHTWLLCANIHPQNLETGLRQGHQQHAQKIH